MDNTTFPRMHVSLYVSNLQQSISFYNTFFGASPVKERPGYAKYLLAEPALVISFIENPERVQANFGHLGFQLQTEAALQERTEALQAAGLISKIEDGVSCCYAKQDKIWANDPDGIQWEVYYFHEDAEFNDPHYAEEGADACCMPEATPMERMAAVEDASCCTPGSGCC